MMAAEGEVAEGGVVDEFGAGRRPGFLVAEQGGKEAVAVLAGAWREGNSEEAGAGGEDVAEAHQLGGYASGRDDFGPASKEGHAVSALIEIAFHAPEMGGAAVAKAGNEARVPIGTVVAGAKDKGLAGQRKVIQGIEEAADEGIELGHEVAISSGGGATQISQPGEPGGVWGGEGQVEEKGLSGCGRAGAEEAVGAIAEGGEDCGEIETRSHETGSPEGAGEAILGVLARSQGGERGEEGVVLEEAIGRLVERVGEDKGFLKPMVERASAGGAGEVEEGRVEVAQEAATGLGRSLEDRLATGAWAPVEAEVPFPDNGGVVTLGAEKGGQGGSSGLEEGRAITTNEASGQAATPGIAAGKKVVTGRGADGRGGVGVGEAKSLCSQAVQAGGGEPGFGVVGGEVAPAEVVGENQDNVRRGHGENQNTR